MTHSTSTEAGTVPGAGWSAFFADRLADVPLVAILRGLGPEASVRAAREAWAAGVTLVEVTLERAEGLASLEAVVASAPTGVPVGAGTVTTPQRLRRAVDAGATFAVTPGLDHDTVRSAGDLGVPLLPGVATPSEVGSALRLGVRTLKLFPAAALGPGWVRALRDPFPEVRLVATGGLDATSAATFLDAGAVGVGLGSALRGDAVTDTVTAVRRHAHPETTDGPAPAGAGPSDEVE